MNTRKMVCIVCPVGCRLEVSVDQTGYSVCGNKCVRGKDYAINELTNPVRTVTSTVRIKGAAIKRLPVKTQKPIPKGKVAELMLLINQIEIVAPVQTGQILASDVLETNVNLVASRTMECVQKD